MNKNRMEAFSDGVIAILITIMVLELKAPHGTALADLKPLIPVFLSYVLSFIYLGIYWNNHHHLLQAVRTVNGQVLWANLHLLFWLSIIPFLTGWMGENDFAAIPVALYGINLFAAACAYTILMKALIQCQKDNGLLAQAMGNDTKGKVSIGVYVAAVFVACWWPGVACGLYAAVAITWLVPDRRIEKVLNEK